MKATAGSTATVQTAATDRIINPQGVTAVFGVVFMGRGVGRVFRAGCGGRTLCPGAVHPGGIFRPPAPAACPPG
ncbi:hypothetical protein OH727_04370, partial [Escherichia coli]